MTRAWIRTCAAFWVRSNVWSLQSITDSVWNTLLWPFHVRSQQRPNAYWYRLTTDSQAHWVVLCDALCDWSLKLTHTHTYTQTHTQSSSMKSLVLYWWISLPLPGLIVSGILVMSDVEVSSKYAELWADDLQWRLQTQLCAFYIKYKCVELVHTNPPLIAICTFCFYGNNGETLSNALISIKKWPD